MELKEVLKSRNVENKIYVSDVYRWLNEKVDIREACEIRDKLMEILDGR